MSTRATGLNTSVLTLGAAVACLETFSQETFSPETTSPAYAAPTSHLVGDRGFMRQSHVNNCIQWKTRGVPMT